MPRHKPATLEFRPVRHPANWSPQPGDVIGTIRVRKSKKGKTVKLKSKK